MFQKYSGRAGKKLVEKRESATIFCRKFFVSQYRKVSLENPLVCHYFRVSKKLMNKGGKGSYQKLPLNIFSLTVPKNFVEEPFSVSLNSGIEKC